MPYDPTTWVDDVTPVNAANLNNLETGVDDAHTALENLSADAVDIVVNPTVGGDANVQDALETHETRIDALESAPAPSGAPSGAVMAFAGSAAPTDWLMCDGATASTATYPDLFTAIGYAYGGAGASFTLPDLRGRVPVGLGTHASVNALGENDGTTIANRRPQHQHTPHDHDKITVGTGGGGGAALSRPGSFSSQTEITQSGIVGTAEGGSGVATDPLDGPAYIVLNYIIKT